MKKPPPKIVFDFETYYDKDYSLRKMTPVEYILDPRFEVIGCAVKVDGGESFWLTHEELVVYLAGLPRDIVAISHNALFDMCILAWRYDYVPALMIDTLGLARAWYGHKLRSCSLDSVTRFLGVGVKGTTVHKVMGMNLAAIKQAGFYEEYADYSLGDADLCWLVFETILREGFPVGELVIMDSVLRCAVQPRLTLNPYLLAEHLQATIAAKDTLLARCGVATRDELMSNDKFAEALRMLGVEPPTKISLTTGKETYAFAKTDQDFMDLDEHENPDVQALVAARLGIKSTIEETRTQRLMSISRLTWRGKLSGSAALIPMALRFSGAHTHRLSGDWKLNMQNLPSRGNNKIRMAIQAIAGHDVLTADSSQIEARIAAWLAGATELVEQFRNREDVYSTFASAVFGYMVSKGTHKIERFVGKTAVLGLQYGLGWLKFQRTTKMQSKAQVGEEVIISDDQAMKTVNTYRNRYHQIPKYWKFLENMLPRMTQRGFSEAHGPLVFEYQRIKLPSGLYLNYHNLRHEGGNWIFEYGPKTKKIYGGMMFENIVQALARIVVMDAMVRVRRRLEQAGIGDVVRLQLQVHDELVYVPPQRYTAAVKALLVEEMRRPPSWGLDIPLDVEAEHGPAYGDTH